LPLDPEGPRCRRVSRGCVETYAGAVIWRRDASEATLIAKGQKHGLLFAKLANVLNAELASRTPVTARATSRGNTGKPGLVRQKEAFRRSEGPRGGRRPYFRGSDSWG
jgi:hypothetical protein